MTNFVLKVSESIPLEGKAQLQFNVGRFNPHHGGWQIATAVDSSVQGWDLRSIRYVELVSFGLPV